MTGIVFRNARLLTLDDDDREYASADVRVEGALITRIAPRLPLAEADRTIDATGKLLMPGLINGHFHSPGNFNKGALDDMPLELFMLYEVPPFECPPTPPRLHYLRTLLGAAQMLQGGVTAVHDDPFYVPSLSEELTDATIEAYANSGLRATVSINMPNVVEYEKYPYLHDLLPEQLRQKMRDSTPPTTEQLIGAYRSYIARWHGACDGRLRAAVSCSAPQRVERDYLRRLAELSGEYDLPYNMHILETRLQRVLGQERFGRSLVRYVHDEGVLNERAHVIHSIWVDEDDMDLLAASGCSIAHNPLCNLKLGSGIMPFRALKDRGVNICLGSDEMCSDDSVNMWSVMKAGGLVHKITEPDYDRWPKAQEMLECATRNAAKAMRLEGVTGQIAVGMQADLILLDLDTFSFTPLNDLRRQLVFCENGSSLRMAMVAGEIVMENGKLSKLDEAELRAEIRAEWSEYQRQFAAVDHWARTLEPIYRAMYARTVREEVPMARKLSYSEFPAGD